MTFDIRLLVVNHIVDEAIARHIPPDTPWEHEKAIRNLVTAKMVQHDLEQQLTPEGASTLRILLAIINIQARQSLAVSDGVWTAYGQAAIKASKDILEKV